jgi:formylglycine-generating enzyme required for sulfatase activity
MKPERMPQIEQLYHAALEREPAARAAFLAEACAGDEELRREVAGLLAYDDPAASFLEVPALEVAARALATPPPTDTRSERPGLRGPADTSSGTPRRADALRPGQVVRNFRVRRKVGAGGMGEVYEAEDLKLGRRVALKVLPAEANPDAQARQRFLREARAASALNHPHVVTIHAVEEADGLDYIIMEYLEGETLQDKLARGPVPVRDVLGWGLQMAEAVAAAHAAGVVHRDLKPGNVLLTPGGRVKVLDFGLATWARPVPGAHDAPDLSRLTSSGLVVGTVPYMSPEQTRGEAVDARSDVFALGSVLYEAATGRRPFGGPSALAILHAIATEEPPPPSTLRPDLPKGFDRVLGRALAKDPAQRYRSAAELAEALRGLGGEAEREPKRRALRRLAYLLLAAAVLAAAAGLGLGWRHAKQTWARAQVPRVEELMRAEDFFAAYDLAVQVEKHLPDDPTLARLLPFIADELFVTTEPPGARVYLKRCVPDGADQPPRQLVGTAPIQDLRIARGEYVLTVEKDGYAPFQRSISSTLDRLENGLWDRGEVREVRLEGEYKIRLDARAPVRIAVKLLEAARVPEHMVFVPGGPYKLVGWGRPTPAEVHLDDYFIDQFEVSNREYKEFVSAGGYRKKEYWKQPFLKDGKELPWEEALRHFQDRTGLTGPRGWSNQEFPEGKANYPVTDVTWYEAAAYAEFRGKQLPTIFQWEKAARNGATTIFWGSVMPWGSGGSQDDPHRRANFLGRGTLPVDSFEFGMSPFGCYHMAGNVAEWCRNRRPAGFTITGGSWRDPANLFGSLGQFPGWDSRDSLGFRCVRSAGPAAGDQGGMPLNDDEQVPQFKPVSEAQFKTFLRFYEYDPSPLDPKVVDVQETAEWRRELLSFVGAGGERALAYLWLPKNFPRPLQVLNYKPGGSVYQGLTVPQETEVVCGPFLKSGRAVFVVVLKGMKERKLPPDFVDPKPTTVKYREMVVFDTVDQLRGLDYLATRPEVDRSKIACFALSMGGYDVVQIAVESRYRSVLMLSAGIARDAGEWIPEASPVNFVPYIRVPKLMIHGRYDEGALFKTSAEPLYRLFSEPKRQKVFDTGHFPPLELWVPVAKDWFDETLGPVSGP